VHGRFGGYRKMPFTPAAFVNAFSYTGTFQVVRLFTIAVWTNATVFPQNGFKEVPTGIFIRKLLSDLVNVHFIASLLVWRRQYQPPVTDTVTRSPYSWL
jgi:hypothetical protein